MRATSPVPTSTMSLVPMPRRKRSLQLDVQEAAEGQQQMHSSQASIIMGRR